MATERGTRARLIAIDGVNGDAVMARARAEIARLPRAVSGGVSAWDASGVFEDLLAAGDEAGRPSARTLLLLYAADLAFRLRWEIRPRLAEGRVVVAAPYVATAIAFGRAAGLRAGWLNDLFGFAPRAADAQRADAAPARSRSDRSGFVEFGCEHVSAASHQLSRRDILERARTHLQRRSARHPGASA
jgi:hypothetical protein